jgi:periplasmic protein TonB
MTQPSSANGAPLHFEAIDLSARHGKAQTVSVAVHVVALASLVFILLSPQTPIGRTSIPLSGRELLRYIPPSSATATNASLGRAGGGGESDPRPTRFGNLAPESSMPLVPPRLSHNENPALPEPPAVFDPQAPNTVATVANLGLPWMKNDSDSAGAGKNHGIGSGSAGTMGDGDTAGAGEGDSDLPYANVVSPVTCVYCPEPGYTEEARKAKLEGKILLRVLVGPDGKAQRIQIFQRLGMGLDERAEQTIHNWRFSPARDAARQPVSSWITVETRFQLF